MLGFLYIPSLSWPLLLALDMTRLSLVPVERAQVHVKPSCGFTLHPLQTGNCTQGSSHKASCQGDPVTWTVLVTESHGHRRHQDTVPDDYQICSLLLTALALHCFEHFSSQCVSRRNESKHKKLHSEVFPTLRKASHNSQDNSDKPWQPSNISSILGTQ